MRSMIYYEFQKIFKRKMNVIAMLAGMILILVCAVNYVRNESFYDADSDSYVSGIQAFPMQEKKSSEMTDYLTEEYLTGIVKNIQEKDMDLESEEAYLEVIRPKTELMHILCRNYMDMGEEVDWERLNEISTEGGIQFYERRIEKVEEYLNMDFSFGNYSEAEKAFWLKKENEVEIPFLWGSKSAMDSMWTLIESGFYLMFVIAICIAPVFASEYESGASALLLSTKYGKTKLIFAKIIASVLFSLVYVALGIGMGIAVMGITVGFHGSNLPVQLWDTIIPYHWTIGETLVISFAMIGPAFLPMSKESGLWNHINYLFPVRVMLMKDAISTLNSYQFGPIVFSYLGMAVLVYLLVSVLSFLGISIDSDIMS